MVGTTGSSVPWERESRPGLEAEEEGAWRSPGLGAQLLGFSPAAPHPRRPGRNWPAVTLGGDPSRVSGKEVLQRGCVGQSCALAMWDRERKVSGQKFVCLVDKPSG